VFLGEFDPAKNLQSEQNDNHLLPMLLVGSVVVELFQCTLVKILKKRRNDA
jgi:hypothetical protein